MSSPRGRVSPPWWLESLGNVEAFGLHDPEEIPWFWGSLSLLLWQACTCRLPHPYPNVVPTSRTELVLRRELILSLGSTRQSPGGMKPVLVPQPHPESWIRVVWGMAWE